MGPYTAGQVVYLPFPYSDLSHNKVRPVLFLAQAGPSDWLGCQITSNPFADPKAIRLDPSNFASGGLSRDSYIRPGKLFTADEALVLNIAGVLTPATLELARDAACSAIHGR